MKRIITLALISFSLNGCANQAPMVLAPVEAQNIAVVTNSRTSNWGDLIGDSYSLKKPETIQRVMRNTITVKPDTINRDKNGLRIYFSKGELMPGSHFKLVMHLKINDDQYGKRGDSGIGVESSYFGGFSLTKAEAAKILKSATNYSKYTSQLDKILR